MTKKIIALFLMLFLVVITAACTPDEPTGQTPDEDNNTPGEDNGAPDDTLRTLDFYYLNDLHGALLEGEREMGMAKIGNFLIDVKNESPETTIILGGGDMVQGTLLSNYFYGENTTRIMDAVGFDATVVGNHEFDWGLEMLTRYSTGDPDVYQAQHSFLGSNIFYEGTKTIPDGIEPYTIIERQDLSIGVIGAMGYGLESSILASMVEGYYFADPVPIAQDYATYLRTERDVDVVVFVAHASGSAWNLNSRLSAFEGDARIDAIFNGHSHRTETGVINGVPSIISGANGSHVGHLQLQFKDGEIVDFSVGNLDEYADIRLRTSHPDIAWMINEYLDEIAHLYEPVISSAGNQSSFDLTRWMSRLMLEATGADIAFQNTRGTRDSFYSGEPVSVARLYDVFPFDNTVVTAVVPGHLVRNLMDGNPGYAKAVGTISNDGYYKIATNNYVFLRPQNNLSVSEDIDFLALEMFHLAVEELYRQAEIHDGFSTNHPVLIGHYQDWYVPGDTIGMRD